MQYEVAKLEGALLDAAVAHAQGWKEWVKYGPYDGLPIWLTGDAESPTHIRYRPSIDWSQGGPIIERERMDLDFTDKHCHALVITSTGSDYWMRGPTALIAAMRAYVASKCGDTVELPC